MKKCVVVSSFFCVFEKVFGCFLCDFFGGAWLVVELKKQGGFFLGSVDIQLNDASVGGFVAVSLGNLDDFA